MRIGTHINIYSCNLYVLHYYIVLFINENLKKQQNTCHFKIIIKTSSPGQSRKDKIVYKLPSQSHRHLRYEKFEKNITLGTNQRLTALLNPLNVSAWNTVGKVIPQTNLGRLESPCKLGLSTSSSFKLELMSFGRSSSMSNSGRIRSNRTEEAIIQVKINLLQQKQYSNMTSIIQRK